MPSATVVRGSLTIARHRGPVATLVWWPNAKAVLSVATDLDQAKSLPDPSLASIQLREIETGRAILSIESEGAPPVAAAISPGGHLIGIAGLHGAVRLHDAITGRVVAERQVPAMPVQLEFTADEKALACLDERGTYRIWAVPLLDWRKLKGAATGR